MPWKLNPENCPGCGAKMEYDPLPTILQIEPKPGEEKKVQLCCDNGHKNWYEATYYE